MGFHSFASAAALGSVVLAGCTPSDASIFVPGGQGTPPAPPVQYTLTVSMNSPNATVTIDERGTVNDCRQQAGSSCELRYLGGEILTLEASPPAGWRFDRWSNCEVARSARVIVRMPRENIECHARFFMFDEGFDLRVAPDRVVTAPGIQATSQLMIERGSNFSGFPVDFRLVDPPAGFTLTSPVAGVTADSASLAIDVAPTVAPGHYLIRISGVTNNRLAQEVSRSATLGIDVTDAGDFYLTLDTPTLALSRSTACPLVVGAHRNLGFADNIDLSSQALPQGVSATFDPNPAVGNSAQWVLSADADAPFTEADVSVAGRAGARSRSAAVHLAVTAARDSCVSGRFASSPSPPDDFAISLSASTVSVEQNGIAAVDIAIDRTAGYTGEVFFAATGVPPGSIAKFDPPTASSGSTKRLIVVAQSTAELGIATITINATGGGRIHTAALALEIAPGVQSCPLGALADAFVNPRVPVGSTAAGLLQVNSSNLLQAAKSYLAFDINSIAPPFDKVEFVLTLYENYGAARASTTRTVNVQGVTDNNDWDPSTLGEGAIDWNNAPKNDTSSTYQFLGAGASSSDPVRGTGSIVVRPGDSTGTRYRVDVTDYLRWAVGVNPAFSTLSASDADRKLTFMLGNNMVYGAVVDDFTSFRSREAVVECDRPHLEVYR